MVYKKPNKHDITWLNILGRPSMFVVHAGPIDITEKEGEKSSIGIMHWLGGKECQFFNLSRQNQHRSQDK